jgi:hypothetical protein
MGRLLHEPATVRSSVDRAIQGASDSCTAEQLVERVRQRLRETKLEAPHSTPDRGPDLATGEGLLGGWYDFDPVPGVRWVEQRFEFEVGVDVGTHLAFDALLTADAGFSELRARLHVNGTEGEAFRIVPGWNHVLVPLPLGVRGHLHCSIDTGGVWSPFERELNRDCRALSIAIRAITVVRLPPFVPASAPPPTALPVVVVDSPPAPPLSIASGWAGRLRRLLIGEAAAAELEQHARSRIAQQQALQQLHATVTAQAARMAELSTRLHAAEAYLADILERRLRTLEQGQRELRTDVSARTRGDDAEPID